MCFAPALLNTGETELGSIRRLFYFGPVSISISPAFDEFVWSGFMNLLSRFRTTPLCFFIWSFILPGAVSISGQFRFRANF